MADQKSVYVTDRTFSALRAGDALSGRINQIVDRYLEIVRNHDAEVRALFSVDDWRSLQNYAEDLARTLPRGKAIDAIAAIPLMLREGNFRPELRATIAGLTSVQAFVMLELLELDIASLATGGDEP